MARKLIIFPEDVDPVSLDRNPASPEWKLKFLAEGDSWFSFGSSKLHSIVSELDFDEDFVIVTLAKPGDTIKNMASMRRNPQLRNLLSPQFEYRYNAILLSGGGNDVIDMAGGKDVDPAEAIVRAAPKGSEAPDYVNGAGLRACLAKVQQGFIEIAAMRDASELNREAPIIVHTYDLVTPRKSPATFTPFFTMGPWLEPAMKHAGVPRELWNGVSDVILKDLAAALVTLQGDLDRFHVVPTQRTLRRAELGSVGDSNDWANEIHPDKGGYRKLARKYGSRIKQEMR